MSTRHNTSMSWASFAVIWILIMILWTGLELLAESRKANLTEKEKTELDLDAKNKAIAAAVHQEEIKYLLSKPYSEVAPEDKSKWIALTVINIDIGDRSKLVIAVLVAFILSFIGYQRVLAKHR